MKLLIIGPQGSGKGTQAGILSKKYGIPKISTGDIIRQNIADGTALGKIFKEYSDKGDLVPDDIMIKMIKSRLEKKDCKNGFILDGFPRNLEQAKQLNTVSNIDKVIVIDVSDRESIKRIAGRRSCKCGMVYHTYYNPSRVLEVCDKCGGPLIQRDDDKEEIIRSRLEIYHKQTFPLIELYKGKTLKINGEQPIENVFKEIEKSLE